MMSDNEKASSRVKKVGRTFDELPPRVIIFDIISFYEMVIYPINENQEDFSHFGIFRRDGTRGLWYIYPSVTLKDSSHRRNSNEIEGPLSFRKVYLEYSKLENLEVQFEDLGNMAYLRLRSKSLYISLLKRLKNQSTKMYRLKKLNVEGCINSGFQIGILFQESFNFPKLRNLSLKDCVENDFSCVGHPFNCLTSFFLKGEATVQFSILKRFENDFTKNLKKLCLFSVSLESPHTFHFSNLETLKILYCRKFLVDFETRKLSNLTVWGSWGEQDNCLKKTLQQNTNIKSLELYIFSSPEWILCESINPLPQLRKICLFNFVFTLRSVKDWKRVSKSLRNIILVSCSGYDILGSISHPKLKSLTLDSNSSALEEIGEFSKDILYLSINSQEIVSNIFQKRDWNRLESLELFNPFGLLNRSENWKNWKPMKNLRSIIFRNCVGKDFFFQQQKEFSFLQSLKLINLEGITGKGYFKVFPSLKFVTLEGCPLLKDSFFKENQFPVLDTIFFGSGLGKISGKGWNVSNCGIVIDLKTNNFENCENEFREKGIKIWRK